MGFARGEPAFKFNCCRKSESAQGLATFARAPRGPPGATGAPVGRARVGSREGELIDKEGAVFVGGFAV
ncbi:MAG: hypothetical protein AAGJ89_18015, partial [Pseudomonadota bacterium]